MLKRKIDAYIRNYYETTRNALLVTGARQIGKTYSIRQFGKTFKSFIEINFVEMPEAVDLFKGAKSSSDILFRLSAITSVPLIKGETLVFFDEVQQCPDIVTAIKFLVDDGSYRYIMSGSLLGIELKDLNGRLLSFGKSGGDNSFYVPVTFEFDNKGDIIPGSFVEAYLLSTRMENVISLPRTALTEEQGLFFVYLQLDEEGYKKQEVTLGADNGKSVQILTGVKAGDAVVTDGAYQVKLASASNAIPAHSHEH